MGDNVVCGITVDAPFSFPKLSGFRFRHRNLLLDAKPWSILINLIYLFWLYFFFLLYGGIEFPKKKWFNILFDGSSKRPSTCSHWPCNTSSAVQFSLFHSHFRTLRTLLSPITSTNSFLHSFTKVTGSIVSVHQKWKSNHSAFCDVLDLSMFCPISPAHCRPLWYFTFAEIVEKSTNHLHFPPAHEQT